MLDRGVPEEDEVLVEPDDNDRLPPAPRWSTRVRTVPVRFDPSAN